MPKKVAIFAEKKNMGLIIKKVLKQKNIGIVEFSEMLGITRGSLWEQMRGNPTVETLQKWADALEIDISELFEQTNTRIVCPKCGAEIKIDTK